MTDQPTDAIDHPLAQLLRVQLQWQQLLWRMPLAMCGGGILPAAGDKHATTVDVLDCAAHAQLAVPGVIADGGDHALFA